MGVEVSLGTAAAGAPGEVASGDIDVRNVGPRTATFRLEVLGDPASWAWISPTSLPLAPGESGTARVSFRVPRASTPEAGPLPYQVRAVALDDPQDVTVADGVLTVSPFVDISPSVDPKHEEGAGSADFQVTVENRGNTPVDCRIRAEADDAMDIDVAPATVAIAPGGRATSTVTVHPRRRLLVRGSRANPFEVVAEADGAPPVRLAATFVQRPALPRWTLPVVVLAVLALVGTAASGLLAGSSSTESTPEPGAILDAIDREHQTIDPTCPGKNHLATEANGITRPGPQPFSYSFLFLKEDDCLPVRFNPCEPVRYVTNGARARPEHRADLAEALRRVTEATGVEFVDEGPTDEEPGPRAPYVPRYGERWAPVLIAWVGNETIRHVLPQDDNARRGGPTTTIPPSSVPGAGVPVPVGEAFVSGMLLLNVDAVDPATRGPLAHGFGPGVNWGRVLLHELGHLMGLGHVESRTNIMQHDLGRQNLPNASWGIGDLIALKVLGKEGGCDQTPAFTPGFPTRPPD